MIRSARPHQKHQGNEKSVGGGMMTTDQLLGELEPLTHNQRVRRMVLLPRTPRPESALAAPSTSGTPGYAPFAEVLDVLANGGPYQRQLALYGRLWRN